MTAPHGSSEGMPDALAEKLARMDLEVYGGSDLATWADLSDDDRREAIEETRATFAPYWPTLYAEVRAAVVKECIEAMRMEEFDVDVSVAEDERWGEFAMGRRSCHRRDLARLRALLSEVDCRIEPGAESGGHLEYVRDRLRALLPPVSAPGPTLPRTPSGWDGPTMREFVRGREWSCVQAETGDVITLDDRGLVTLYGFDGTPLSDLQALLAALASRAERGPGDAND